MYAATKKANELMAHTYSHLFGLPTTGLRFFTVYGPWGRPDMALFLFTKAILEGRPIDVFNHGQMVRDFTYIDDIAEGVVRVLDRAGDAPTRPSIRPRPDPARSNAPYRVFNIGNSDPVQSDGLHRGHRAGAGQPALKNLMPLQDGDVPATFADVSELADWTGLQAGHAGARRRRPVRRTGTAATTGFDQRRVARDSHILETTNMTTIAVIGLGYVGLPLAVEFGKKFKTLGFDLCGRQGGRLCAACRPDGRGQQRGPAAAVHLTCSTDPAVIGEADFIIVAVPTPVDDAHQPDFTPLVKSSESVGRHLKRGAIVVFESTVYPGATEEVCIPIIEKHSGLKWKQDFFVGYSPERINPGDKERTVTKIVEGGVRRHAAKRWRRWPRSTARSSPPACTRPAASRWPKPPR